MVKAICWPWPIIINMKPALIEEFAECELGAHEDGESVTETEKLSAYTLLRRRAKEGKIEIRNAEEADLIFYAAASGTFGLMGQSDDPRQERIQNRAANRICDILREHAKAETIRMWGGGSNGF